VLRDLRAKYGSDVSADFSVNPKLIGGLRIRIGDDVFDGSVRGRLARLEQGLATI
jgi:F-type H+-transporting ATPase subunit delta